MLVADVGGGRGTIMLLVLPGVMLLFSSAIGALVFSLSKEEAAAKIFLWIALATLILVPLAIFIVYVLTECFHVDLP